LGDDVADDLTVLADEPSRRSEPRRCRTAEELEDRRSDIDETTGRLDHPEGLHAGSRGDEGCAGLHHAERPVLAQVTALVAPVVRCAVQDDEVGSRGVIEELGEVVECMGIRVRPAVGMRRNDLFSQARTVRGVLEGDGVLATERCPFVVVGPSTTAALARIGSLESKVPVGRGHVVDVMSRRPRNEIDDGLECMRKEHVERPLTFFLTSRRQRSSHHGRV
jgi:hypothetical protein